MNEQEANQILQQLQERFPQYNWSIQNQDGTVVACDTITVYKTAGSNTFAAKVEKTLKLKFKSDRFDDPIAAIEWVQFQANHATVCITKWLPSTDVIELS